MLVVGQWSFFNFKLRKTKRSERALYVSDRMRWENNTAAAPAATAVAASVAWKNEPSQPEKKWEKAERLEQKSSWEKSFKIYIRE